MQKHNIFHQKFLILSLFLVLISTLPALHHCYEDFQCMWDVNFHSELNVLSLRRELTFDLQTLLWPAMQLGSIGGQMC